MVTISAAYDPLVSQSVFTITEKAPTRDADTIIIRDRQLEDTMTLLSSFLSDFCIGVPISHLLIHLV